MENYKLDRFGGWTGKRFRPTGYFRIEKDERWWLVTPEGNAFISFGINHLHPYLWQQDFNAENWRLYTQIVICKQEVAGSSPAGSTKNKSNSR